MSDNILCRLMLILSVFYTAGCSVKERRDDCPCRLVLDFTETDISSMNKIRICLDEGDFTVFEKDLAKAGKPVNARSFFVMI